MLFRISKPQLWSVNGITQEPNLPGGKSPKVEWLGTPDRVPEISARFREATACASQIMRTGKSTSGKTLTPAEEGVPAFMLREPPPLSPNEQKLARLLRRQSELAELTSAEAELEYAQVVAQIAEASAEMETTQ